MIFDTDVLVYVTRGHAKAADLLDADETPGISVVTLMELFRGARNMQDLRGLRRSLDLLQMPVLPTTPAIGLRASAIVEQMCLSHQVSVPDALIAATAMEHGMPLCTANRKHFQPIDGLELAVFTP